jgi:hypothetical protein
MAYNPNPPGIICIRNLKLGTVDLKQESTPGERIMA